MSWHSWPRTYPRARSSPTSLISSPRTFARASSTRRHRSITRRHADVPVRFHVDAQLPPALAGWLREAGCWSGGGAVTAFKSAPAGSPVADRARMISTRPADEDRKAARRRHRPGPYTPADVVARPVIRRGDRVTRRRFHRCGARVAPVPRSRGCCAPQFNASLPSVCRRPLGKRRCDRGRDGDGAEPPFADRRARHDPRRRPPCGLLRTIGPAHPAGRPRGGRPGSQRLAGRGWGGRPAPLPQCPGPADSCDGPARGPRGRRRALRAALPARAASHRPVGRGRGDRARRAAARALAPRHRGADVARRDRRARPPTHAGDRSRAQHRSHHRTGRPRAPAEHRAGRARGVDGIAG